MIKVLITYIIIQLLTTAYGVSVIESVRPIVKKKLDNDGYVLKNTYSMYKFNSKLSRILKGFIPFYYAYKAINLIKDGNPVEKAYNKEIEEGNYITRTEAEEQKARIELAKNFNHIKVQAEPNVGFEKSEKYVARHNDFNLLKAKPKDVKYEIIENKDEENEFITPFKPIVRQEKVMVKEVTKKDVVKAIMDLNSNELDELDKRIQELSYIKKKNKKFNFRYCIVK